MIFTSPLMLFGLLALPALAAIYWLRSRSRRVVVSSLILWTDQRRARQGGLIWRRMQAPLSFFLELLAIALLVAAAAGPALLKKETIRPLIVVLDDSYSMQTRLDAEGRTTPRTLAEEALREELARDRYSVRFILAGVEPRWHGEPRRDPSPIDDLLAQWTCRSAWADLPKALALAGEIGGTDARILVLTDRASTLPLDGGQVQWWAFGAKRPNAAFTAAARTPWADGERVLLEAANLSDVALETTLTLEGGHLVAPRRSAVQLAPGAAKQFVLDLPAGAPPLTASLGNDVLEIDNRVLLLPDSAKPLRVLIRLSDEGLHQAVLRALDAAGRTVVVEDRPELVFSDSQSETDGGAWRFEILSGAKPAAYAGPFVIDRNHPLTEGLSLDGAIWSAATDTPPVGAPVVTAGNVLLLTDREDSSGRHVVQMRFAADASNLQDTPDWPILFANLLHWRREGLPGAAEPNVRLGRTVGVTLPREFDRVELLVPGEPPQTVAVHGRRIEVSADRVGLYAIKTPEDEYHFACNTVSRDESDLTDCTAGRWGNWNDSLVHRDHRTSLGWIFMLGALASMTGHLALIAREARSTTPHDAKDE